MKKIILLLSILLSHKVFAQAGVSSPELSAKPSATALDAQSPLSAPPAGEPESPPALERRAYIWMGVGYNYVNMKQHIADTRSHAVFESYLGPSFAFETLYPVSNHWDFIASYRKSPGAVGSPEGITVESGSYAWDILTLEGQYSKPDWNALFFEKPAKFYLSFGLNENRVPFWERSGLTTAQIKTNQVLMASIGGQVDYQYSPKWTFTSSLRFHQPLSSSSGEVKSQLSLDGSIGAFYKLDSKWDLGTFWYGRYHNWNFKHMDPVLQQEVSGRQELLFSDIEVRVRYGF